MIWESYPWKRELAQRAESLRARCRQRRWTSAADAKTEQDVFLSAYVVRKLLDSKKISDEVEHAFLDGLAYKATGGVVDIKNWDRIDRLYDLSASSVIRIGLRAFCDQVIHSFVFVPCLNERDKLDGIFVASDRRRSRELLFFPISGVIDVLLRVAKDDIVHLEFRRERVGGEARIVKKSNGDSEAPR